MPRADYTRKLTAAALFTALSIVLGKYLAITAGPLRFSLENLPILLSGIVFGPGGGALVGMVADLIGSILVGYAINPIVTLGAATIGALSGLVYRKLARAKEVRRIGLAVGAAHLFGSCLVKSAGLYIYYSYPLGLIALRLPLYFGIGLVETWLLKHLLPVARRNL